MKIAITGGRGFVGKYLLELLSKYYECIVLGRGEQESLECNGEKIAYMQTSYEKEQLIEQLEGVQAVVHMAAKKYEAKEQMSDYFTSINASDNLFFACAALNISNIVFLSSRSVYGADPGTPWHEERETLPGTFYGISKVTIERIAAYYNSRYDLNIKILRLAQIIGHGERKGYMINIFINRAINKESLEVWGEGKGSRDYVYVKDVVRAVEKSLAHNKLKGIINIGSNRSTSHRVLAETVNSVFDNIGNLNFLRSRKEDEAHYLMNSGKAACVLGWIPKWRLREALADMKKELARSEKE